MLFRTSLTAFAATAALLTSASTVAAATTPLSAPRIADHFDLTSSQQPENITVDGTGTAYLTFSFARQVVRLVPGGRVHVLATLPAPAELGIALGQLVIGPLSDTLGRRRPLLIGLTVYVGASAVCAIAPNPAVLIGMRLVQGLAGAAGIVIARAVVRDLHDGLGAARLLSSLMLVSGTAPVLAPVLGAQLLRLTSWRGVFITLTLLSLVILTATTALLNETLPTPRRHSGGLPTTLRTMRDLVHDRHFTGYLLTGSIAFAALFAYIAGSSFALQRIYGASPQTYGLLFALNSCGMVATGQLNGKLLLGRFPSHRVLATGLTMLGAAGAALVLLVTTTHAGLPWIAAALFLTACPVGMILPTTTALCLQRAPHAAGSASALLGTTQFLMGALAPALAGLGGQTTALPMAMSVLGLALAAAGCFLALCRPWRPTPDPLAR